MQMLVDITSVTSRESSLKIVVESVHDRDGLMLFN